MLDKRSWKRATWTMITEKELSWFMLEDCFCGVIHMKQVSEPFSVGNPVLVICNQGITWVQCAWRNSNIWATAMFDASGKLFQIYFDIADEVFIDGENTWFTDLIVDVVYQPGELKVVAYDANGKVSGERVIHTAGKPSELAVSADRVVLTAPSSGDTPDLAFVTVDVVDEDGNLCPDADCRLRFDTEGAVAFRAVCNGDPTSIERFSKPSMKAFGGRLVVLVEALRSGMGTLHVTSDGLKAATVKFMVQ